MTPEIEAWNKDADAKRRAQLATRKSTLVCLPRTPRVPSRHPFKALLDLRAKVDKIRETYAFDSLEYQIAIAALPPYKGRGKGGSHRTKNRLVDGRWNQDRGKYQSHQGKSEKARRVFQTMPAWIREETRRVEELI